LTFPVTAVKLSSAVSPSSSNSSSDGWKVAVIVGAGMLCAFITCAGVLFVFIRPSGHHSTDSELAVTIDATTNAKRLGSSGSMDQPAVEEKMVTEAVLAAM